MSETPSPAPLIPLAVDVVAFGITNAGELTVASIERQDEDSKTVRALPGALVMQGERIKNTAHRALSKLTADSSKESPSLYTLTEQVMPVVDTQGRDYRLPSMSLPLIAFIDTPSDSDIWVPCEEVAAFDHQDIISTARVVLARKMYSTASDSWAGLGATGILPAKFRTADFNRLVRTLGGDSVPTSSANLNRVLTSSGISQDSEGFWSHGGYATPCKGDVAVTRGALGL